MNATEGVERVGKRVGAAKPLIGIARERLGDDGIEGRGHTGAGLRRGYEFASHDRLHDRRLRWPVERARANDGLVEHATESENVHAPIDGLPGNLLGRHVRELPAQLTRSGGFVGLER